MYILIIRILAFQVLLRTKSNGWYFIEYKNG